MMNVITGDNYKPIDEIPLSTDQESSPDIVIYANIFTEDSLIKITDILEELEYTNNTIHFADNSFLIPEKSAPFPIFLDDIRDTIEKITKVSFNCCVIRKYDINSHKLTNKNDISEKLLKSQYIIPYVFFGYDRNILFSKNNQKYVLNISNGTIMIKRKDSLHKWQGTIESHKESHKENNFFSMQFLYIFPREHVAIKKKKEKRISISKSDTLETIYLNNNKRIALKKELGNTFIKIHKNFLEEKQCILSGGVNYMKKFISLGNIIGYGEWGNVYIACLAHEGFICDNNFKFAVKMSRITEEDIKDPYTETSSSWFEIWMLKDIFTHIIDKNICPNLPLLYDTFLCDNCDLSFKKGNVQYPCIITIVEIGSGDLRDFLESFKLSFIDDDILFSALFQIMAALHSIQMTGQILNNDIKARNILCYDVKPGGYWAYKCGKETFYVPNYGKMFVLNDFGVSTLYNPNFQLFSNKKKNTFNLGSRYAINIDDKFSPIEALKEFSRDSMIKTKEIKWLDKSTNEIKISHGATYRIDRKTGQVMISHTNLTEEQKVYLFKNGITTNPKTWGFFLHPYHIPPFEFYNDTQDVLRMFTGGKRSTQSGNHRQFKCISKTFKETISKYMGKEVNSNSRSFSLDPYHVLAGNFITKFFKKYTIKPSGKIIAEYNLNDATSKLW